MKMTMLLNIKLMMMMMIYKVVLWASTGRTVKTNVHKIVNKDDAASRMATVLNVKMALRDNVVILVKTPKTLSLFTLCEINMKKCRYSPIVYTLI